MQKYANVVQNRLGTVIAGASVSVTLAADDSPAALFSDNGVTTKANPFNTDGMGRFEFYAADGRYNITISRGVNVIGTLDDILLEDPADGSEAMRAPTGATLVGANDGASGSLFTTVAGFIARLMSTAGAALVGANDGSSGTLFTTLAGFFTRLFSGNGSDMVGFLQSGSGAVQRTLKDKGLDAKRVTDYMSQAQKNDARAFGFTLDCSDAFNAALVAGNGAIIVPYGGYIAKNLTIPPGVTIISVHGEFPVNNYYQRPNSTVIDTQGGDFIKGSSTSMLFCARDIFIKSSGQNGMCFGTTSAVETGFCFENLGVQGFEKGFWAPQYSSSSFARDTSFTDCDYGLWSVDVSNNTKLYNMGYNRCANGVRICGFGVEQNGMQFSLGYTGAHAGSFPEYICCDLFTGLVNVRDAYHENYGLDYSKNIIFNCRSSTFGDDHYKLDTFLSSLANMRHLRVYSENPASAIKSNLIELNGSVVGNTPNIETKAGQTGLIRGIKINDRAFNTNGLRTVFDTYDVEAVITAGTAKVTSVITTFGSSNVTAIGFDSPSITGYSTIINNAAGSTAAGRFFFPSPDYHHCPLGSTGKTSGLFEMVGEVNIDGLSATKTYALGLVFRIPGGGYTIRQIGIFRALAVPGGSTFNFNAVFVVRERIQTGASIGVCFIPSATVDVPSAGEITGSLYGRLRLRFIED